MTTTLAPLPQSIRRKLLNEITNWPGVTDARINGLDYVLIDFEGGQTGLFLSEYEGGLRFSKPLIDPEDGNKEDREKLDCQTLDMIESIAERLGYPHLIQVVLKLEDKEEAMKRGYYFGREYIGVKELK